MWEQARRGIGLGLDSWAYGWAGGDLEEVGDDGAGGGAFSGSGAVEHDLADGIAFYKDSVIYVVDAGEGMGGRD